MKEKNKKKSKPLYSLFAVVIIGSIIYSKVNSNDSRKQDVEEKKSLVAELPTETTQKTPNKVSEDIVKETPSQNDVELLKEATQDIANSVALKGGVEVETHCIELAANEQVVTFRCVTSNSQQKVSFKQKYEVDQTNSIGWKPVWNERVEKALKSLKGYSPY